MSNSSPVSKARYRDAHPTRVKAARARWTAANPGYSRRWAKANPEKIRAANEKWKAANPHKVRQLRKQPLPTRPEAEWCECCGRLPDTRIHLDHDHITGEFRGWLCSQCNTGIGLLGDNAAAVEKALVYLKRVR